MRKIRMLVVGLVSLLLPLSLTTGGLTPFAQAAEPAATPITGLVLPAATTDTGTLTLNPVANARGGSITAKFSGTAQVKNRPVYLYKSTDSGVKWTKVGPKKGVKLSSSGSAVFTVSPVDGVQYKAIAPTYKYKVKKKKRTAAAVSTEVKTLSSDWTFQSALSDGFSGTALDSTKWKPTLQGDSGAGKRWCSVPWDDNASVKDGALRLTMSKADKATTDAVVSAAKAKQKAAGQTVVGCPNGVFFNARVSNEHTSARIKTGIVAAEVTFPIYQGGHGGVWLRTANNASGKFDEIDIVEAFGWKKGIQAVLHLGTTTTYETPEAKKWVAKKTVGKSSWWGKSHVFSVEFTRSQVIYRLDGVVTRTDKRTLPDAEYSIVMSMLSSDWETGRLKKPAYGGKKGVTLPMSTKVNWIKTWTKAS